MRTAFDSGVPVATSRETRARRLLLAAVATILWSIGSAGPASAQYVTPEPPLTGAPTDVQTSPVVDATSSGGSGVRSVAGAAGDGSSRQVASRSGGQGLAVTGGDVVGLTVMGVGAIAAGGLMLRVRRRVTRA